MSIISIDIGTSSTKIIEFKNNEITNKAIYSNGNNEKILDDFINRNNINDIEYIVTTGIGAGKGKVYKSIPIKTVSEFEAIAEGGKILSKKEEILIASIGTGTAFIRVSGNRIKHLGGTGVGAGTLTNLCNSLAEVSNLNEIIELAKDGDLKNIDLRIGDVTNQEIETLPKYLTLANFGNLNQDAKKEDLVLGIINMVFEVIGMMSVFCLKNDTIKEVILIGNVVTIPRVKEILEKIEITQGIRFIIPENPEYIVAIGAILKR